MKPNSHTIHSWLPTNQNFRRGHGSRITTNQVNVNAGVDIRRALMEKLNSPILDQQLNMYQGENGETPLKANLVFVSETPDLNSALQASCNADSMCILNKVSVKTLAYGIMHKLPMISVFPIDEPEFYGNNIPNFTPWLASRILYPSQTDVYALGNTTYGCSPRQIVRVLMGFLAGALNDNNYHMSALILHSLQNYLKIQPQPQLKDTEMTKLKTHLETKDSSKAAYASFFEFINTLHPSVFFYYMYRLSLENPEILERSQWASLDEIILSLVTQPLLKNQGIAYAGVSEMIVRLIFERTAKYITSISLNGIFTMEELCKTLHTKIGASMVPIFKRWAIKCSILAHLPQNFISINSIVSLMTNIDKSINDQDGLLTFMITICPELSRHIDEMKIAEFILAGMKKGKDEKVIPMTGFVTETSLSLMTEIIKANQQSAKDIQDRQETLKKEVSNFNPMMFNHGCERVAALIIALVQNKNSETLKNYLSAVKMNGLGPFGLRRARAIAVHSIIAFLAPEIQLIFIDQCGIETKFITNKPTPPISHRKRRYLPPLFRGLSVNFAALPSLPAVNNAAPVTFIPLNDALARSAAILRAIAQFHAKYKYECLICANDFTGKNIKYLTHPDGTTPHPDGIVCEKCYISLTSCPLCRGPLSNLTGAKTAINTAELENTITQAASKFLKADGLTKLDDEMKK